MVKTQNNVSGTQEEKAVLTLILHMAVLHSQGICASLSFVSFSDCNYRVFHFA